MLAVRCTRQRQMSVSGLLALLLALGWCVPAVAQDEDHRFLQGLRQRGLFSLAELYCTQRLQDEELDVRQRAELTVELAQTYAQYALHSPPAEQPSLWQQAQQVLEKFVKQHPKTDWKYVVQVQQGVVSLLRGEALFARAEATPGNRRWRNKALEQLRIAIKQLQQVKEQLQQRMRRRQLPPGWERLPQEQDRLLLLKRRIDFYLGRAYRLQAELYEPDSPDRALAARTGLEHLNPIAGLRPYETLHWEASLEAIRCLMLLQRWGSVQTRLDLLEQMYAEPERRLRLRAERIELALAQGRLEEARRLAEQGRTLQGATSAELDFALLKYYLAAWRKAQEQNDADAQRRWQQAAQAMIGLIDRSHGRYWSARAETLLAGTMTGAALTGNLGLLARQAQALVRQGQLQKALALYDQATREAQERNQPDEAFLMAYTAASLVHQKNDHQQAWERFRQAALTAPDHPQAAEAHLLAVFHAWKLVQQQKLPVERFVALLNEHVRRWPHDPTTVQVRLTLARLLLHQKKWNEALEVLKQIDPGEDRFPEAMELVHQVYRRRWAASDSQAQAALVREAALWFEQVLLGPGRQWPVHWAPVHHHAARRAARWWLTPPSQQVQRAGEILDQALADSQITPEDRSRHAGWRILAYVLQGRDPSAEVAAWVEKAPVADRLELVELLDAWGGRLPANRRHRLAAWQKRLAEGLLASGKLSPEASAALQPALARALLWLGRWEQAVERFRRLHQQYPRQRAFHVALAEALLRSGQRPLVEESLQHWRLLQRRSRPGSAPWFQAKYHLAEAYLALGQRERARRIVEVTEVLHPEFDNGVWKERFQQLKKRLR